MYTACMFRGRANSANRYGFLTISVSLSARHLLKHVMLHIQEINVCYIQRALSFSIYVKHRDLSTANRKHLWFW